VKYVIAVVAVVILGALLYSILWGMSAIRKPRKDR